MNTFHLTIATLDETFLQDDVCAVYFPTSNGEVGVLTNHTTYLTDTLPGQIRYTNTNKETSTLEVARPGIFFIQDNKARLWIC